MAQPKLLQDRTVVITGAATGIGQAFALASCAHGANVVVADIGQGRLPLLQGSDAGDAKARQRRECRARADRRLAAAGERWPGARAEGAGLGATPNLLALQRYRTWPSHA